MEKDFYVDQRWLAAYFEKDWFDKVTEQGPAPAFQFSHFPTKLLYSPYHEEFVNFLSQSVKTEDLHPKMMLEVGSSLGRTFYEICKTIPSVNQAVLLEPSQNLSGGFKNIFNDGGIQTYPILLGNRDLTQVDFNSDEIKESCAHVDRKLLNCSYEEAPSKLGNFDLVICSNVIDQCHKPNELVHFLKDRTSKDGILALSCTYQWNDKYLVPDEQTISDVRDLFDKGWQLLDETNIEFRCRRFERHWVSFLSHVLIFKKLA